LRFLFVGKLLLYIITTIGCVIYYFSSRREELHARKGEVTCGPKFRSKQYIWCSL